MTRPKLELINSGNTLRERRVENKDAWCDLGYMEGFPEFTIVQLSFFGDYKVTDEQLKNILKYATQQICSPSRP